MTEVYRGPQEWRVSAPADVAQGYANQTAAAWDQLMAAETAAENQAEADRLYWRGRPHKFRNDQWLPGFCERCSYNASRHGDVP